VLAEIEAKFEDNSDYNWHFVSYGSLVGGLNFTQSVVADMRVHYWKILSCFHLAGSSSSRPPAWTLKTEALSYFEIFGTAYLLQQRCVLEERNHETVLSGLINETEIVVYISSVHGIACAYFLKNCPTGFKTQFPNSSVNKCRNALY
jgi:hypothetical protein